MAIAENATAILRLNNRSHSLKRISEREQIDLRIRFGGFSVILYGIYFAKDSVKKSVKIGIKKTGIIYFMLFKIRRLYI